MQSSSDVCIMGRYELIKLVGEGSFGLVHQAIDHWTGQYVAIKELKESCDPMTYMPEVCALRILQHHPNIVGFKEIRRQPKTGAVFLVFEYMDGSLWDLINQRATMGGRFSEAEIISFSFQLLQGLDFMHWNCGIMHRDLKPENLLINNRGFNRVIKISDLGSAIEIECGDNLFHHHYVTTRYYRAPELLLRMLLKDEELRPFKYDEKVDMWAVGVIIAELYLMRPLFRGTSSEDQLHEICKVIGAPTMESRMYRSKLGPAKRNGLRALMPNASDLALDLIESLCSWNPSRRPSAAQALRHPFFTRASVGPYPGFTRDVVAPPPVFARNVVTPPGFARNVVVPARPMMPPPGFSCSPRQMRKNVVNMNVSNMNVSNMNTMQPIY